MAIFKKEFIDKMAETGGITKKEARRGVELFIETLMDCMAEGEDCIVPEHRKMKFYASEVLADRIEGLQRED